MSFIDLYDGLIANFFRSITIWYRNRQGEKAFLSYLPIDMIQGLLKNKCIKI